MAVAVSGHRQSGRVTARRTIKALAYLWLVFATAVPAIDIVRIVGQPPPADMFDLRDVAIVAIFVLGLPWLIAVMASAGCLSEMRASPRSHAPVWWLVVVLGAYGYWLVFMRVVEPWIGGGATLMIATAVLVLDIVDMSGASRRHLAAGARRRAVAGSYDPPGSSRQGAGAS